MSNIRTLRPRWYKLDNAAKIFPGQNTGHWSNVFRLCAVLREPVQPDILEQALRQTLCRFPLWKVQLKHGFFWHYFKENPFDAPPVMEDIKNPCHRIQYKENNRFLFRVYYRGNRIAVDPFHSICDGYGCAVFTFSLLAQYYRLLGETIPCGEFVRDVSEKPSDAEAEDAFLRFATSKAKYKRTDKFCYHPACTKLPAHMVNITAGILSFSQLHALTRAKNVTITEYLAAVLVQVHMQRQRTERRRQKEISVQIPINLRKVFPCDTLRNFSINLRIKLDPNRGEYTFDEILRSVSLQLRLANNRQDMNMYITANTAIERNRLLRLVPLPLKDLGVRVTFAVTREQTTTALLTNLGGISLPQTLQAHIDHCFLMPAGGLRNPARCGVITTGDALVITFANGFVESDIERDFFTFLVRQGLHVKIESNR